MHCKSRQIERVVLCALAADGTGEEQCVNDENGMICKLLIHSLVRSSFHSLAHSSTCLSTRLHLCLVREESRVHTCNGLGSGADSSSKSASQSSLSFVDIRGETLTSAGRGSARDGWEIFLHPLDLLPVRPVR